MAISKFTLENGLQVTGSSNFSGSVSSSGGFTGSLLGTASYGQDANLLDGLDSTAYARLASANTFTETQTISGNLYVTGTVSASVVTASQGFVSGGLTIGDYVQLLPVGATNIPANLTASYIYTSGSTNDLYFTQYQGPFTNTTRLRWLESLLVTGLLHGGILSTVNGSTTFSITSGSGLIVNYNASTTTDPYPTINFVSWPTYTSASLIYSGSAQISYISINGSGEIAQETTPPDYSEYKDRIFLGRVLHQSASVTNGAFNTPQVSYGFASNTADYIRAIGPLKISGHFVAPSGSTLSLTKSAGDSYVEGRNYTNNPDIPSIVTSLDDTAVTISKIYRERVSGGLPVIDTGIAGAGYTTVDPTLYQDANGNLASVGIDFSVQRVYWFPRSVNRAFFIYYGQAKYANIDEAVAGINTENFVEGDNTRGSAILVAYLVMKGNIANFDTSTTARIYQGGIFRGGATGGGGGISATATTLASLSDVSIGTPVNGEALIYDTGLGKWTEGYPNSSSYATNAATASYVATGSAIATFTNDVRNQFSAGNNIGISAGVISLSSSVSTTAVTGTTGVSGALGLFPVLTGSSVSGTTAQFTIITGSAISGALIGTLNGVSAILAGTNLTASTVATLRTISLTSSVAGLTSLTSTTGSFTILSGTTTTGSTALFTTVTGSTVTGSTLSYTTLNTTQMTSSGKILVDNNITIGNGNNRTATDIGIGYQALASSDANSNYNIAIGYQALSSSTSGSNIAIGYLAGKSVIGSTDGIYIGREAGLNSKANSSIAIGTYALNEHSQSGNATNVAIGTNALKTFKNGGGNYAIGSSAGAGLVLGDFNVAIGTNTLAPFNTNVTGYNNIAVGAGALGGLTNANNNTAIGYASLASNTTGESNMSIGLQALNSNTTGIRNTAIGNNGLLNNVTGSYSIAIGYDSLANLRTGSSNIAVGYAAATNLKTGSNNVYIGNYAGVDNVNNNIYISDGAGNLRLQVDSNGALSGTVITGSTITGSTAQFTTITGSNISGALIGTLNTISVINAGTNLTASNVGSIRSLSLTSSVAGLTSISSSTGNFTILTGSTTSGSTALFTNITASNISGTSNLYIGGNIGIGTSSPATQLDVRGTGSFYSIKFPSVQSSSTDPNTLDDYEEGTWTPAYSASVTSAGWAYNTTNTSGSYIKIGKMMRLTGRLAITSTGSSAGSLYISGLPSINADSGQGNWGTMSTAYYANFATSVSGVIGRITQGDNKVVLSKNTSTISFDMVVTDLTNNSDLIFVIQYNTTT